MDRSEGTLKKSIFGFGGSGPCAIAIEKNDSVEKEEDGIVHVDYGWTGKIEIPDDFDFENDEIGMRVECSSDHCCARADLKMPLYLLKDIIKRYEDQSRKHRRQLCDQIMSLQQQLDSIQKQQQTPASPATEKPKRDFMCITCLKTFEDSTEIERCISCSEWYCLESETHEVCGGTDRDEGSLCRDCALATMEDMEDEERIRKEKTERKRKRRDSPADRRPKKKSKK
jgi:hypothetical protein